MNRCLQDRRVAREGSRPSLLLQRARRWSLVAGTNFGTLFPGARVRSPFPWVSLPVGNIPKDRRPEKSLVISRLEFGASSSERIGL